MSLVLYALTIQCKDNRGCYSFKFWYGWQALNLDSKTVKKRQVEFIDIAMDPVENYVEEEDPLNFRSKKTGRGPLEEGWQVSDT